MSEPITCDFCGAEAGEDDYSAVADAVICPVCMEDLIGETTFEPRSEVGMVGGFG